MLVAATAGAILLIDGGDSPAGDSGSQTATEAEPEPGPIVTDVAEPGSGTKEAREDEDDRPTGDDRRQPESGPGAGPAAQRDRERESAERDRPRRERDRRAESERAPECPPPLSRGQCAALTGELGGSGSTPTRGGCPPGMSDRQCNALQESYENAGASDPFAPGECPPSLTQRQCEQLAAAIDSGG